MENLQIAPRTGACGTDKPLQPVAVTTPAGDKTYTDSFYQCRGGSRVYVNNIGELFNSLSAATGI